MQVDKHVVIVLSALFAGIAACILISYIGTRLGGCGSYFYYEDIATHIEKNPKVSSARILGSEFDVPSDRYDIEINTVSGYRICLHYVKRSCRNREISLVIINDIHCFGGGGYVLCDGKRIHYWLDDFVFLGMMLGTHIQSVDDIVEHAEELYGLFELFEANSGKEFMYGENFLIDLIGVEFKRGGPEPDWPL